jgi:hypothetical protein
MSATLRLLERAGLVVVAVMGLPQFAHADFINLVSQTYQIHESVSGCCPAFPVIDQTSATPISRTDDGVFYDSLGRAIGRFHVFTSADGGVAALSAFAKAAVDEFDISEAYVGANDAGAAITFRPLVTDAVVQTANPWSPNYAGPAFGGLAGLYDETAGAAVLAFGDSLFTPALYSVSLNMDHLYTLYASAGPGPQRGITLSLAPASVPEADSTLTFLALGLGALAILERRRAFCSSN